ncbi:MAG: Na+/H+ antiporter NhaA, partial [Gemmatimonadota bacterium]
DIAFALGVLALLGNRVPTALKVFVAALAIVDDIGAVLVIALFIMPLFALSNAGVALDAEAIRGAFATPVAIGALLGLVIGKPIGITLFSWLGVRAGVAALPEGVDWRMLAGAGVLGGIGFTMALFIAGLAFTDRMMLDAAKVGVLGASALTGVAGWLILNRVCARPAES